MVISVIIASYKRTKELEKCLRFLEEQRRKPEEVIIALQSADKESLSYIKNRITDFSLKIKAALTDKKGKIFQENAALKQATGDVVCFIDDDAQARHDWLKRIEQWYSKDEKIGGVGGRDIVHQTDGTIDEKRVSIVGKITWFGRSVGNHHNIVKFPRDVDFLKGCNMTYRRKLLDKIDESLLGYTVPFEEEWIGFAIRKRGYKIIYDPEIVVDHYPPTARKSYQDLRSWSRETAFIRGHNQVFTLLTYFPFPQKVVFILYSFLMGDVQNPGPGRLIVSIFKRDFSRIRHFIGSSFRGKVSGLFAHHGSSMDSLNKLKVLLE